MSRKLREAVIDSSALMSIALNESSASLFLDGFKRTEKLCISAATRAESWLAVFALKGHEGAELIEALLAAYAVETIPFDVDSLAHYQHGGAKYHHKFNDRARLNIGDVFTYSLARQRGLPLFFQGTDFPHTDIKNAMKLLGYEISALGVPEIPLREG